MKPEKVSAIIFDIDNFKSYNDHYSHMKGDEALKFVAQSIVNVLERSDRYLFRFGGEEFVTILPGVGADEAREIACEFLGAVRSAAIPREDTPGQSIVTASFGIACGTSEDLKDLSLIKEADRQLYISKNGGKDCIAENGEIFTCKKQTAAVV